MIHRLASLVLVLFLAACADPGPYRVVLVPEHSADLYPLSQTRGGITIAIDEMRNPSRVQRHFGADLAKEGILPVNVVISNYGRQRVVVKPADLLLYRGREVIDALPVSWVSESSKRQHGSLHPMTEKELDRYIDTSTFKETVLAPGETYRGVMFFAAPVPSDKKEERFFTTTSVYLEGGPRMRIGITDVDSGERLLFGPFSLSLPGTFATGMSYTSWGY